MTGKSGTRPAFAALALSALVMTASLFCVSNPARAGDAIAIQPEPMICAERTQLIGELEALWGEKPVARGLSGNGAVVELLTSGDGGSFTILMSMPDGQACMMASGNAMEIERESTIPAAITSETAL